MHYNTINTINFNSFSLSVLLCYNLFVESLFSTPVFNFTKFHSSLYSVYDDYVCYLMFVLRVYYISWLYWVVLLSFFIFFRIEKLLEKAKNKWNKKREQPILQFLPFSCYLRSVISHSLLSLFSSHLLISILQFNETLTFALNLEFQTKQNNFQPFTTQYNTTIILHNQ